MPWSPPFDTAPIRDPRLDPFRNRVAELWQADELCGHALWLENAVSPQTGGWLWWRRWAPPHEILNLDWQLIGGEGCQDWVDPVTGSQGLDALIAEWAAGRCEFDDIEYELRWLDATAAIEVGERVFDYLATTDDHGHIVWMV